MILLDPPSVVAAAQLQWLVKSALTQCKYFYWQHNANKWCLFVLQLCVEFLATCKLQFKMQCSSARSRSRSRSSSKSRRGIQRRKAERDKATCLNQIVTGRRKKGRIATTERELSISLHAPYQLPIYTIYLNVLLHFSSFLYCGCFCS